MKTINKRIISLLLCAFILMGTIFTACACGNKSSDTSSDDTSTGDTSTGDNTNKPEGGEKPEDGEDNTKPDEGETKPEEDKPLSIDEQNKRDEVISVKDNNYLSRGEVVYEDINGKDVTVYTSFRVKGEVQKNPNFAQIQMVWQAIKYKDKYPDKDVYVTLTSYRLSGTLAGCLDEESPEYGDLKCLYSGDYDEETGYYRLSYLLCEAARKGIYVTVIGHANASSVKINETKKKGDEPFYTYFSKHLNDPCYIEGKVISDYMVMQKSKWTLDKGGTDMMHLKSCTVSNYIDRDGNDRGTAVWLGCTNVDGVDYLGRNGLDYVQSGAVICDHDEIYRVTYNFTQLMAQYDEQEEILVFRRLAQCRATDQINLIKAGRGDEIPYDEQIVYIGTESDKVFELYFTPLGGEASVWDTEYNPYCKYITKLVNSPDDDGYIEFLWNNPKYGVKGFSVGKIILDILAVKFLESGNPENNLHIQIPGPDYSTFDDLKEGENIGVKALNRYRSRNYHSKDVQMTYVEDGVRYYVTLFNSLNMHEGAMFFQTNSILVVKETEETGNDFYIDYAIMTVPGIEFESHRYK